MKSDGLVFGTDKIQRGGVRTFGGPPAKASVGCRSLEGGRRASMSYVLFHMDGWPDVGKLSVISLILFMCRGVEVWEETEPESKLCIFFVLRLSLANGTWDSLLLRIPLMGTKGENQAGHRTRWRAFDVIGYWALGIGLDLCALYARPQPPDGGGACTPPATSDPQARLANNLFVCLGGGPKKTNKRR